MFNKQIEEIDESVLKDLIENEIRESKYLEYKSAISRKDSDSIPLLCCISSFANTAGGDLVIGIKMREADPALPKICEGIEVANLGVANLDEAVQWFQNKIHQGLEPQLPSFDIHPVKLGNDKYAFVIRVQKSWIAPHRVKSNNVFYARHSAGRYELDVAALRASFTMLEGLAERIRNFRIDRIAKIYSRETPIPLKLGGCGVIHILPYNAFAMTTAVDIPTYARSEQYLSLLDRAQIGGFRINFDGYLVYGILSNNISSAYTQLFRTGIAEAVAVIRKEEDDTIYLDSGICTKTSFLKDYIKFAKQFKIAPPYYIFLSFIGVKGGMLWPGGIRRLEYDNYPLREEMLIIPEITIDAEMASQIDDNSIDARVAMQPALDMLSNAFGREQYIPKRHMR